MANEKRKAKMTKQEAIHILMNLGAYVEYDECFGIMEKAPLVDACVVAIKALKADAVEVVHGEWEITEDDYYDLVEMKCSVCGESYGFEDYEDDIPKNYHYCPNCGAKMDGDGNDNT